MSNNNAFDKYAQYKNTSTSDRKNELYVGLTPIKIVAINPDQEALKAIIGDGASKFDTTYPLRMNYNQKMVRPLAIWVQDVAETVNPILVSYSIGESLVESKGGKSLFMGDDGKISYANNVDTLPSWIKGPFVQLVEGSADWYSLVYKLFKWQQNEDVQFIDFLNNEGLDVDTIYGGNFTGVRNFVNYLAEQNASVTAMLTVRKTDGDNGVVYRQSIMLRDGDFYYDYTGKITDAQIKSIVNKAANQESQGYTLTNDAYFAGSITLFNEVTHFAHIPDTGSAIEDLLNI